MSSPRTAKTVAILTDLLDGHLARKHNIITRFGKLADPIADKALTGMAFIGLGLAAIDGRLLGSFGRLRAPDMTRERPAD